MYETEAAKTIKAYFNAFNAHDHETYLDTQYFPHIRINDKGRQTGPTMRFINPYGSLLRKTATGGVQARSS